MLQNSFFDLFVENRPHLRFNFTTVKVNGHVIERLTLKIDKNVKTVEIDHSGAYLHSHKLSELLNLHYNGLKVFFEG